MGDNRKTIIYKVNYDISDPIRKQIEWADDSLNNRLSTKFKVIYKGEILLYRYVSSISGLEREFYCVSLSDSDNKQNYTIICPLMINKVLSTDNVGINIGMILKLDQHNEFIALFDKIKKIKKNNLIKLTEIAYKKEVILNTEKVELIIDLYKKLLQKISGNKLFMYPISTC